MTMGATAMDALSLGYKTTLIIDGCRGIDPRAVEETISKFKEAGGTVTTSSNLEDLY